MIQDKLQFGDEIMNIYELLNKIVVNRRHSLSANLFTEEAREELDENEKHIFDLLRNISSLGTKINNKRNRISSNVCNVRLVVGLFR